MTNSTAQRFIPGRKWGRGPGFSTKLEAMNSRRSTWICVGCGRWYHEGKQKKNKPVCDGYSGSPGCGAKSFLYFASEGEAHRWTELRMLADAGVVEELRRGTPFVMHVHGPDGVKVEIGRYVSDFDYRRAGEYIVEDYKGGWSQDAATDVFALKRKHVEAEYGIRIRIVSKRR